mmetsp:Transcript_24189/g.77659  ORF Transcript_24189/g.77659 Transcript_24189/m.77659 type:complete len:830 (+) Transcript_24189:119-2608(+)
MVHRPWAPVRIHDELCAIQAHLVKQAQLVHGAQELAPRDKSNVVEVTSLEHGLGRNAADGHVVSQNGNDLHETGLVHFLLAGQFRRLGEAKRLHLLARTLLQVLVAAIQRVDQLPVLDHVVSRRRRSAEAISQCFKLLVSQAEACIVQRSAQFGSSHSPVAHGVEVDEELMHADAAAGSMLPHLGHECVHVHFGTGDTTGTRGGGGRLLEGDRLVVLGVLAPQCLRRHERRRSEVIVAWQAAQHIVRGVQSGHEPIVVHVQLIVGRHPERLLQQHEAAITHASSVHAGCSVLKHDGTQAHGDEHTAELGPGDEATVVTIEALEGWPHQNSLGSHFKPESVEKIAKVVLLLPRQTRRGCGDSFHHRRCGSSHKVHILERLLLESLLGERNVHIIRELAPCDIWLARRVHGCSIHVVLLQRSHHGVAKEGEGGADAGRKLGPRAPAMAQLVVVAQELARVHLILHRVLANAREEVGQRHSARRRRPRRRCRRGRAAQRYAPRHRQRAKCARLGSDRPHACRRIQPIAPLPANVVQERSVLDGVRAALRLVVALQHEEILLARQRVRWDQPGNGHHTAEPVARHRLRAVAIKVAELVLHVDPALRHTLADVGDQLLRALTLRLCQVRRTHTSSPLGDAALLRLHRGHWRLFEAGNGERLVHIARELLVPNHEACGVPVMVRQCFHVRLGDVWNGCDVQDAQELSSSAEPRAEAIVIHEELLETHAALRHRPDHVSQWVAILSSRDKRHAHPAVSGRFVRTRLGGRARELQEGGVLQLVVESSVIRVHVPVPVDVGHAVAFNNTRQFPIGKACTAETTLQLTAELLLRHNSRI